MEKMTSKSKYVPVSLTEEMVMNYSALPPELDGWRYHRIEYGGFNEACFMERPVMLPPCADAYIFDLLFDFWQAKTKHARRKILHKIIEELERGL
jgi:hypothetical protein